ncbi:putative Hydrolase, alpha/beta fold family [Bradyrhizobium sp. ORS 278]|uniref:alpha/beta fold hydrolase n=1 Tax=Bradyrhizobium sp. (strain ORS 278) TaxID=114615 RepID=UPI0001508689|nr:alpha/beta hydrolase [Bradyrhizobium sp. ORS 278]CAL77870.1 putative Hydrolase, alpha/beta fold family [Bradyrhizobium sp. ORS 278]
MTEATHQIISGRARLAAEVKGRGEPVIFLHAAVFDRAMWRAQVDGVAATHMAIAYDRRGFGETVAEPEEHSPVADLLAVLDALAPSRPATLVACSQGGRIALDFALSHPLRIRALILIAPSISGAPEPVFPSEIAQLVHELAAAEAAADWDRVSAIKARLWIDGPLQQEGRISGALRSMFLEKNAAALRNAPLGASRDTTPAFPRLAEISAPSLVVWGDLDFPHIQERSRWLAATLPNGSSHAMSGVAHLPSLERPAEVTDRITAFLAGL